MNHELLVITGLVVFSEVTATALATLTSGERKNLSKVEQESEFDCFEHIHSAMRALDFMRMVRMEGGHGSACDGDEIPPHLRHPTRQGLTGKAAMVVVHAGRKISLDATIDSKPDPAGKRLRIHYGWSSGLQRYVVGWVSDLAPKAQ